MAFLDAARTLFELRAPVGAHGGTGYSHAKRLAERRNEEFTEPTIPDEFSHLLVWHREIRARTARGMRFEPIPHDAITAYKNLFRLDMDELEADLLCQLDDIWQGAQPTPNTK